ncbi:hypothetical protein CHLRE_17g741650v5 [Chlamydomonas reinhardtii]|uniref:Uncharacterized protein n=1 Tax=Chlamydomonas reinhardtii TaxID=3055 RepID=A0A2K3CRS5_CHLRE|nr:uncharacterized protein CHLRE_17g741650v5 [Chlamydomonas reinhardtii]PNW70987.1 hypothetical protein CHLRE_17g741650v5 [Chlamydomonas reinhardtii]
MINALTKAEQDHLSDNDCVVVLQKTKGLLRARLAVVEGMLAPGGRDKKLKRARRMDRQKAGGVVQLRFLQPMPPTGDGELAYFMSHKMTARLQKLDVAKVAMVVFLDKKLAVDGEKGGRYAVDPDHAKELRTYCREAGAVLDCADGYDADAEATEAAAAPPPQSARQRQQKLKARVDPRALQEVDDVLAGKEPRLSSRGRRIVPSEKARQGGP